MKNIKKKYDNFIPYQMRNFRSALNNVKLTGISVLSAKGTVFKKINIPFIIHSVFVNATSVLIFFNTPYV